MVVQVAGLDKAQFIIMKDLSASLFIAHARSVCLEHIYQRCYRALVLCIRRSPISRLCQVGTRLLCFSFSSFSPPFFAFRDETSDSHLGFHSWLSEAENRLRDCNALPQICTTMDRPRENYSDLPRPYSCPPFDR